MQTLAEGHRRFERDAYPADRDLYDDLAHRHRPSALFIGCSDARVVPEVITSRRPGELFVVRTAGNLVPPHGAADGTAASIEYAVEVLDVSEVVVCGHSACGAMTALALEHDLSALPAVAGWLATAGHVGRRTGGSPAEAVAESVRADVARQVENLATYPGIRQRVSAGQLRVVGWVHDIGTGRVETVEPDPTVPSTTG